MAEMTFFKSENVTPSIEVTLEQRENYNSLIQQREELCEDLSFLKENNATAIQLTQMQENIRSIDERITEYEQRFGHHLPSLSHGFKQTHPRRN